jgi:hypothetical protein
MDSWEVRSARFSTLLGSCRLPGRSRWVCFPVFPSRASAGWIWLGSILSALFCGLVVYVGLTIAQREKKR